MKLKSGHLELCFSVYIHYCNTMACLTLTWLGTINVNAKQHRTKVMMIRVVLHIARRLRAKFWPDCAIPDTSMKFGTVVDHD